MSCRAPPNLSASISIFERPNFLPRLTAILATRRTYPIIKTSISKNNANGRPTGFNFIAGRQHFLNTNPDSRIPDRSCPVDVGCCNGAVRMKLNRQYFDPFFCGLTLVRRLAVSSYYFEFFRGRYNRNYKRIGTG